MFSELLAQRESEDCGCPEEEWDIAGIHTTIHMEPDGSGHIFLDTGEWEDEKLVDCENIIELKQKAIEWIESLPLAD